MIECNKVCEEDAQDHDAWLAGMEVYQLGKHEEEFDKIFQMMKKKWYQLDEVDFMNKLIYDGIDVNCIGIIGGAAYLMDTTYPRRDQARLILTKHLDLANLIETDKSYTEHLIDAMMEFSDSES